MEEREGRREMGGVGRKEEGRETMKEREREKNKFSSFHGEFFRDQRNDVLS